MKTPHKPKISKGFGEVRKMNRKYGMNKNCTNCIHWLFDECQNKEVTEHDMVYEHNRQYCCFFNERKSKDG